MKKTTKPSAVQRITTKKCENCGNVLAHDSPKAACAIEALLRVLIDRGQPRAKVIKLMGQPGTVIEMWGSFVGPMLDEIEKAYLGGMVDS